MAFRVSPQVESELDDIWLYIATESASVEVADRVVDSITLQFFIYPSILTRGVGATTCALGYGV